MKRANVFFLALLTIGPLRAADLCQPTQTSIIEAEARCVDSAGISIGLIGEEGVKVACMEDRQVQGLCGPDGRLTRLRAYTAWFNKLKQFEDSCTTGGGTFAFQDPNFKEPQNESFCLQAVPEVGSNMFEEPLCNFRSSCPAVAVVCDRPCAEHSVARLF